MDKVPVNVFAVMVPSEVILLINVKRLLESTTKAFPPDTVPGVTECKVFISVAVEPTAIDPNIKLGVVTEVVPFIVAPDIALLAVKLVTPVNEVILF